MQRMIVKECCYGIYWNEGCYWQGQPSARIPAEAYLHSRMPRHKHLVEYLGFSILKQLKMARLYSAFAELGDLCDLLANHKSLLKSSLNSNGARLHVHIPTVAILFLFEAMAAGACLMAHGAVPDDDGNWPANNGNGVNPRVPRVHNIVHRDIKASNYFLATPSDSGTWPQLPIVKLGDFGNGIDSLDPLFVSHPDYAYRAGTSGWRAPEQNEPGARKPIGFANKYLSERSRDIAAHEPQHYRWSADVQFP